VSGARLYYADRLALAWVPTTGGPPTPVAQDVLATWQLVSNGSGVYWFDWRGEDAGTSGLRELTLSDGLVTSFASAKSVRSLCADDAHIVWADEPSYLSNATIWASPPQGSSRTALANNQHGVLAVTADATAAYWATSGAFGSMGPIDILTAPFAGGPAQKLACQFQMCGGLAVDDTDVHFVSWSPSAGIAKVPKHG
jgi:hypothetical protein